MMSSENRFTLFGIMLQSALPFHGNGEPLYLFVFTQFRTEATAKAPSLTVMHFSWNCSK